MTEGADLIFYYFNFMVKGERPEAFLKNFQIRAIIHWPGGLAAECWADNTMLTWKTNWTFQYTGLYWTQKYSSIKKDCIGKNRQASLWF